MQHARVPGVGLQSIFSLLKENNNKFQNQDITLAL